MHYNKKCVKDMNLKIICLFFYNYSYTIAYIRLRKDQIINLLLLTCVTRQPKDKNVNFEGVKT